MCKIWIFGGTTEGRLLAEYCSREKIEAWVSVASEYGEELLQEELMESGNAGNPDLNHNTKESGQCADKEICFAKKSLKNVQASSVIKVLRGRMDRYQMEEFIRNQGIHLVIDATHPHARLVSEEIQEACGRTGVRLERCLRAEGEQNKARDWVEVDSIQEAVSFLQNIRSWKHSRIHPFLIIWYLAQGFQFFTAGCSKNHAGNRRNVKNWG